MRIARAFLVAALVALSGACRLPDVQPFADATLQLRTAAVSSGRAISDDIGRVVEHVEGDDAAKAKAKKAHEDFETAWKARNAALSAMVDYSNTLVDVASAPKDSGKTIDGLVGAVTKLSGGVGIPLKVAGEVRGVVMDAAKFITAQIETVLAQKALDGAMRKAQPIIVRISEKLVEDLESMRKLAQDCAGVERNSLAEKYGDFDGYWNHFEPSLLKFEPVNADAAALDRQVKLAQALADAEPRKQERDAAYEKMESRLAAQLELLGATSAACEAWAQTHAQLATAVANNKRVDVQALVSAGNEIKGLVERVRGL